MMTHQYDALNMTLKNQLLEFWNKNELPQSALVVSDDLVQAKKDIIGFISKALLNDTNVKPEDNSDVTIIELENNKAGDLSKHITIDQIRQLRENFSSTSGISPYKFGIILGGDYLNLNSSNALLKILEDTPKNSYLMIVASSPNKLIRTIQSRLIEVYRGEKKSPKQKDNAYNFCYRLLNPEVRFEDKVKELDKFISSSKGDLDENLLLISNAISSLIEFQDNSEQEYKEIMGYIARKNISQKILQEFVQYSIKSLANVRTYNLDLRQALLLIASRFMQI